MQATELVTTLKRQATRLITRVNRGQGQILITERGRPAAYLVGVDSFEALRARVELLEGIARGEKALAEGRAVSHSRAKEKLKRWLK